MKTGYKVIGIALLVVGAVVLSYDVFHQANAVQKITLPGNIKGFSDVTIMGSEAEIKAAFTKAEATMNENAQSFKMWSNLSVIGSWVAFFLGGVITLLAGYLGYFKVGATSAESLLSSITQRARLSKIVGVIAASATLTTGFSVKAKEAAEQKRTKGIEIRDLIISSYKDLQQAKPEEVNIILEKLKLQSNF